MLMAQQQHPVRNDWFSGVSQILKDWEINISLEEIRNMKRSLFKSITKKKAEQAAFVQLVQKNKSGSKGSQIKFGEALEMADYLCPNNMFSIEEQRETFQIRSQTNTLPANRGDPQQCPTGCGRILDNPHIVQCPAINTHIGDYSLILNGTLQEKKNMLKHFKVSLKKIDTIDSTDSILDC